MQGPSAQSKVVQLSVTHRNLELPTFRHTSTKLVVQSQDGIRLIACDRVLYLKAEGSYARVVTEDGSVLVSKTLKGLIEHSLPQSFARCHQSFVVNLMRIDEVRTRDVMEIVMDSGHAVPVSRRQISALKKSIYTFFNH